MKPEVILDVWEIQGRAIKNLTWTARRDYRRYLMILDFIKECIEFQILFNEAH